MFSLLVLFAYVGHIGIGIKLRLFHNQLKLHRADLTQTRGKYCICWGLFSAAD